MIFYFLYYFSFQSFHYSHTFLFLFLFYLFFPMLSPPPHTLSLSPPFFFLFLHTVPALSFSLHLLQLTLSGFFFSSSSIHVFFYLFISPFFSFFFSLVQEVLSLFFFLQLSVSSFFFFLLDSRIAVVFVRRVGGRGHLCNFTLRAAFSPQFSFRFGRKKIGGSGRKIFSQIFHSLYFPLLPKQWKTLFFTPFSTHRFPSSL